MEKELEELSKTTDVLKEFKSRVGEEDKTEDIEQLVKEWKKEEINNHDNNDVDAQLKEVNLTEEIKKSNMDSEYLDDDTTLELSDIELDKTVILEDNERVKKVSSSNELTDKVEIFFTPNSKSSSDISNELNEGLIRRQKQKKYGLRLVLIVLFFIPIFITLLVIGKHSNELISKGMVSILYALSGLCSGLIFIGGILYLKNIKIKYVSKINKIFKYIYMFFMVSYTLCCATFLFLLYGPINDFRDWLVTTAMATKDHQYYCTWFYNKTEIDEVFSRNYIKEPNESTDETLVNVNADSDIEYANEYEKAVLTKDTGNDLYKIINFEVNGCKAYLAVIYDPSKIRVTTTDKIGVRGQYVTTMAKREKAKVAINGAGFYDPGYSSSGGSPKGITIVNGKIVTNNEYGKVKNGGLIGFTNDNKLVLLKNVTANEALAKGVRDAVSWGPFLIVNGKAAYTKGNGGWGYAARTAIGQRADGIVLLLVVDSNYNRTKGADMVDMTEIMQQYGAINASNLDGGTSSVMVVNGELISHPIDSALQNETRPIATSFVVTE